MSSIEMKYSGIDWIGDIPKDWKQTKIRSFVKENSIKFKNLKNVEMIPLSLGGGRIYLRNLDENKLSDAAENYKLVQKDNLVIGIRAWQNSISVSDLYGFVSPAYKVYNLNKNRIFPSYLKYYVNNVKIVNHYITISQGICSDQWKVDDLSFRNLDFFMPPISQQTAIANYLDHHTSKIDKEISLLDQKVEKLDEYKQALIYETVTKGLDKNVPMKDSGIEWIGMIPEHWEVKRVKDLFDLKKGKNAGDYSKEYILDEINKGEYPVYSGQTENEGVMGNINTFEYNFLNGTLFTTTVGAKAMTVTKIFGKFSLSQNCGLLINKKKSNINWNYYMVLNCFEFTKQNIPSYMQPSLRKEDLSNIFCFNVPYTEQQQIAGYLDEQCSKIDKKKDLINKKVELLKEYKQSLIYESVTGKREIS